ncbi:hypothetical protein CFOL_v3_03256 [Cephalotus follicularis]|uniref:Uncharacterized protein n=1 Tax=Cephalotus follicularis TaxID=3775 RepID=A0A1Q3AVM8_CEPFO|nr:hypothetical protein CFOL_v3_03256 [Cephalotus follicularis]
MKAMHFLIMFCLLATVAYFYDLNISPSSTSSFLIFLPGRRSMRELRILSASHQAGYHNVKVLYGETEPSKAQEGSVGLKYAISEDNLDDPEYHIDYHGVTTHPTPNPKHPKP